MARAQVLLHTALAVGSALRNQVSQGLGALSLADRNRIHIDERPNVGDSLDLDEASRAQHPQANRWDYIVSVPRKRCIVGIEAHSAKDSEIAVIIAKKKHALGYLVGHLSPPHHVARWIWVSSGRVGFSRMEKARRRLDQHGIAFEGKLVRSLA